MDQEPIAPQEEYRRGVDDSGTYFGPEAGAVPAVVVAGTAGWLAVIGVAFAASTDVRPMLVDWFELYPVLASQPVPLRSSPRLVLPVL